MRWLRGIRAAAGVSLLTLGTGEGPLALSQGEPGSLGVASRIDPIGATPFDCRDVASFHHDHILGTSLDLWVIAPGTIAEVAEQTVLDEIERLNRVFSTFDPQSELSRLNQSELAVSVSPELLDVLRAYEIWQRRSEGALNAQSGALVRLWRDAENAGREPDSALLKQVVQEISRPGWEREHQTLTRRTSSPLDLNAIAKGYIIKRAAAAVRDQVPGVRGLLLNLGGDLAVWGTTAPEQAGWTIGIQDPFRPEENADPVARFTLKDQAVATSGGYQRGYTIGETRHSHIIDPRTGRPAGGMASATVLAPDNVTANALATTLCVLSADEGLRLVQATPGTECLLIAADGRQLRSPGLRALEASVPVVWVENKAADAALKGDPWPEDFQVSIAIELPKMENAKRYRRPYVAVWVEDGEGQAVRSLTVWGNSQKYLKDLSDWWKLARNDAPLVRAVTRATRAPGKYSVVWDGKDDKGKPVPQGTYTVRVEVHREHGKHLRQSGKIVCGVEPARVSLEKNEETETTSVQYGKKK